MTAEKAMERINFVVYGENAKRISVKGSDSLTISLDLHKLHKKEADRLVNNVINVIQCPFSLEVIHGYNHGTVLKEHINTGMGNKKIVDIRGYPHNPGITMLSIA